MSAIRFPSIARMALRASSASGVAAMRQCSSLIASSHAVKASAITCKRTFMSSSSFLSHNSMDNGGVSAMSEDHWYEGDEDIAIDDIPEELRESAVEASEEKAKEAMKVSSLPLDSEIVDVLRGKGIETLFPIQQHAFDAIVQNRDFVGRSRTGTGKTLAFALPVVQKILNAQESKTPRERRHREPACLVIAPTRELAKQISREFEQLSRRVKVSTIYGGVSFGPQANVLDRGVDVVVGTPGRLIDHLQRGTLVVRNMETVILDECDEMLRMGFARDVEEIMMDMPAERQNVLFSATLPPWVKQISSKFLKNPYYIDLVGSDKEHRAATVEAVKHDALFCPDKGNIQNKSNSIENILRHYNPTKSIVFCPTKSEADVIARFLNRTGMRADAIHGNVSQARREDVLSEFRHGNLQTLVATDVAARGLDVPDVQIVIQGQVPQDKESYVHRSGRTGRAGKKGHSVILYDDHEAQGLLSLENTIGVKFNILSLPTDNGAETSVMSGESDMRALVMNVSHADEAKQIVESAASELGMADQLKIGSTKWCGSNSVAIDVCSSVGNMIVSNGRMDIKGVTIKPVTKLTDIFYARGESKSSYPNNRRGGLGHNGRSMRRDQNAFSGGHSGRSGDYFSVRSNSGGRAGAGRNSSYGSYDDFGTGRQSINRGRGGDNFSRNNRSNNYSRGSGNHGSFDRGNNRSRNNSWSDDSDSLW